MVGALLRDPLLLDTVIPINIHRYDQFATNIEFKNIQNYFHTSQVAAITYLPANKG
jgi:hypothetical protein